MARKHHEDEVLRSLRKKNDVRIESNCISILKDEVWNKDKDCLEPNPRKKWDLGNGSWGKLDFLKNHCDYYIVQVADFNKKGL